MTTEEYRGPIPSVSSDTEEYWKGLLAHKLVLPKCNDCGKVSFPPRRFCPHCMSFDVTWTEMSGRGKVHTFSVVYQNKSPGFAEKVPYTVGFIELDEGPQMMSNVIDADPESVAIGDRVQIVYQDVMPDLTIPLFRPA